MNSSDGLQVVPSDHPELSPQWTPQLEEKAAAAAKLFAIEHVQPKRIGGLRRTTFWLVSMILLLLIAGAVGGGYVAMKRPSGNTQSTPSPTLSQSQSVSPSSRTSSTSTTSSTSSASTAPSTTPAGYTGCPGINSTIYTAISGAKFTQYCFFDIDRPGIDYTPTVVNNFNECIELCDASNLVGTKPCKALSYDILDYGDYLRCWLKNDTGTLVPNTAGHGNSSVIAILLQ